MQLPIVPSSFGLADGVALFATGGDGRVSLGESERIRRTLGAAWLELFTVRDLFGTEPLLPVNRCPTRSSVPAAQKLLVDAFVAGAASCPQLDAC